MHIIKRNRKLRALSTIPYRFRISDTFPNEES
jgi:hypothetical protein